MLPAVNFDIFQSWAIGLWGLSSRFCFCMTFQRCKARRFGSKTSPSLVPWLLCVLSFWGLHHTWLSCILAVCRKPRCSEYKYSEKMVSTSKKQATEYCLLILWSLSLLGAVKRQGRSKQSNCWELKFWLFSISNGPISDWNLGNAFPVLDRWGALTASQNLIQDCSVHLDSWLEEKCFRNSISNWHLKSLKRFHHSFS